MQPRSGRMIAHSATRHFASLPQADTPREPAGGWGEPGEGRALLPKAPPGGSPPLRPAVHRRAHPVKPPPGASEPEGLRFLSPDVHVRAGRRKVPPKCQVARSPISNRKGRRDRKGRKKGSLFAPSAFSAVNKKQLSKVRGIPAPFAGFVSIRAIRVSPGAVQAGDAPPRD